MEYRLFDHTADLGVEVTGAAIEELYAGAAFALFDLLTDLQRVRTGRSREIDVRGENPEDLLVQLLMHRTRETFERTLGMGPREIGMRLLYDICHNIAKIETLPVEGRERRLCVHRKGATRAFPPGHPDLPASYRKTGQPVLIPGNMGTGSYVLAGTEGAFTETFGSACHGAGRVMSRTQATKACRGRSIPREMAERGVIVLASGRGTLQEENPEAYKNLDDVVDVVHRAGLSRKVAKLRSIGCIKG